VKAAALVLEDDSDASSATLVYREKVAVLNDALQEIGMGRYQWGLFIVTGFGYISDNLWPIVTGLILPPIANEFNVKEEYLKLGQNIGLLVGAVFWGVGADIWGRKLSFNLTLFITGVFGTAAGGAPNFITLTALTTVFSAGVGGNLPVDSAVFLEFVPVSHQYLLTVLSVWWAVGQLIASLVAWPLLGNFSCSFTHGTVCLSSENRGWRYFQYTMGGFMMILWAIRFFVFKLYESPKYLMGRGRDQDAVDVVHKVARYNGVTSSLGVEELKNIDEAAAKTAEQPQGHHVGSVLQQHLHKFDSNHLYPLFATRKLAYSTSLLIILWAFIGLAFALYNSFIPVYLATRGADFGDGSPNITYRNQVIISVIGLPGAIIAGYMVDLPIIGRRGTLAISTVLTGMLILISTTARNSNSLLGWNCAYSFTSNIMYGVLYAITPELFPTKDRGTGNALTATGNRICGVMAPVIALYANLNTPVPIFIAGAVFISAGLIALLLPYESRGRGSL